jgi:hypothetical protein
MGNENTIENKTYRRKWLLDYPHERGWMTEVKAFFPKDYKFIGAEVGVWEGEHSWLIVKNMLLKELYLIDPWKDMSKFVGVISADDEDAFNFVAQTFLPWPEVSQIRLPSVEAAKKFPDKYFDFVYIDGAHDYDSVLLDIKTWHPKIKTGSFLCGHDSLNPDVVKAIKDSGLCDKVKFTPNGTEWTVRVV